MRDDTSGCLTIEPMRVLRLFRIRDRVPNHHDLFPILLHRANHDHDILRIDR